MAPQDRPSMTVVVPARNAARHIERCLGAIRAQSAELPVIVVDSGTGADDTADRARRFGATVASAPGATAGQARNVGAALARSDLIAFVDADNEVQGQWLDACASAFDDPGTAAAGYSYRTVNAPTWVQCTYDALRPRPAAAASVEWLGAGNLVVRRTAFEEVGGFDTELHTCEDVAFCGALRARGYRLRATPGMASVHHGDPATIGALFRGELWRGRDNLRASLRPPRSWRSLAGLALSASAAAGLALTLLSVLLAYWIGPWPAAIGACAFVAVVLLRTGLMLRTSRPRDVRSTLGAVVAVAAAYEVARGLALLVPASHDVRADDGLVKHEA